MTTCAAPVLVTRMLGNAPANNVDPTTSLVSARRKIVPDEKLVFTDAYAGDWMPKAEGKPFMTAIVTFEDEGGQRVTRRGRGTGRRKIVMPACRWDSIKARAGRRQLAAWAKTI
jgi:uncharacterized protein YndB with AHSA1/START domain